MPPFLVEQPVMRVVHRAGIGFGVQLLEAWQERGVQVRDLREVLRQRAGVDWKPRLGRPCSHPRRQVLMAAYGSVGQWALYLPSTPMWRLRA
jgi:hypothetical protein